MISTSLELRVSNVLTSDRVDKTLETPPAPRWPSKSGTWPSLGLVVLLDWFELDMFARSNDVGVSMLTCCVWESVCKGGNV